MELKQLELFVRVLEARSFSRAAAQLNLTQSTLSRQIGLLERELGQRLLTRTGRGVVATEAGQALDAHARTMIALAARAREALRDLQESPRGRVTIGLPPRIAHLITTPLVQRFRARFPHAVVTIAEGLSMPLREWLIASRLDMALLFDPPPTPQLEYRTLARESLVLVGPPGSAPLPRRVAIAALADYPLVLPSSPHALRSLVDAAAHARGVPITVVAEVDSVNTVRSLVAGGVAYSVLPETSLQRKSGGPVLQVAALGPPAIRNRLVLALPRTRPQTRLVRDTVEIIESVHSEVNDAR